MASSFFILMFLGNMSEKGKTGGSEGIIYQNATSLQIICIKIA